MCTRTLKQFRGEVVGDKCPECEHSNVVHDSEQGCVLCRVVEMYENGIPPSTRRRHHSLLDTMFGYGLEE